MKKPYGVHRGKDFIVLPLIFVFLTILVLYVTFAPIITPYTALASLLFGQTAAAPTDRFQGLSEDLAQSGTVQLTEYPVTGDKIGQIDLQDTSLSVPLYYGDGNVELNKGAGLYTGAWLPGEGRTIMAAGHAGTFFKNLQGVEPGMQVQITTYYGVYVYEITKVEILEATDTSAYDFSRTDENLIMYTCYPFDALGYTPLRYFVYAKYVSGPVIE